MVDGNAGGRARPEAGGLMAVRLTYLRRHIGRPAFAIALAVAGITAVTGGTGARAMAGDTAGRGGRAGGAGGVRRRRGGGRGNNGDYGGGGGGGYVLPACDWAVSCVWDAGD